MTHTVPPPHAGRQNVLSVWSYAAVGIVAFAIHLFLATRLYDLQVFRQYDVLFNADPNEGLVNLSHGWGKSEFKHPTLIYLFSPFARAFAATVHATALSSAPVAALREHFALFLLAALSAVRAVVFLRVAEDLGLGAKSALTLSALAFFAFANFMFGAVPDSFALSGTCIAIGYYLALNPPTLVPAGGRPPQRLSRDDVYWGVLFLVGAGITITNVIPLGLLLLLHQTRRRSASWLRSAALVAGVAVAAVGINFCLAAAAKRIVVNQATQLAYSPAVDQYTHKPSATVVRAIFSAYANGVIAAEPAEVPLSISPGKTGSYRTALTFESPQIHGLPAALRAALVAMALLLGFAGHYRASRQLDVLFASVAILLSNFAIHLFFGDEYVLYSLHWHYSLMVIVAGVFMLGGPAWTRRVLFTAGVAGTVLVAGNNIVRVQTALGTLAKAQLPEPYTAPALRATGP